MLCRIRDYFKGQDVLAVDTPSLSTSASSDLHIESLAVTSTLAGLPLYLHTSPESCMKRLLASGYPDIYSLCRVYRDGEVGKRHQTEFTMLEWYRLGFELQEIIDDTLAVIARACEQNRFVVDARQVEYRAAFIEYAGVDPIAADIRDLAAAANADDSLCDALGVDRDSWLDLILTSKVVTKFPADALTVITHYPGSQAAMSRLCPADPVVADRFEVFHGQLELANGYVELLDAHEQAARIAAEQQSRERLELPQRPADKKLVAALASGLPACAGVALGIERLQMILENTDDIRNVVTFDIDCGED